MWKKVNIFLAAVPAIIAVVVGIIGYQLDQKGYELETKKFREGQIPKKNLQIVTYGGTDVTRLFKTFTDATFSINIAGKEVKSLYSISYHIENTGEAPILKSDFSENLTLTFPERWQILVLKNSKTVPPGFNPVWERISNHELQLKPLLINAGDKFSLEVYLSDTKEGELEADEVHDELRGTWTVRIPTLSKIDIKDPFTRKVKSKKPIKKFDNMDIIKMALEGLVSGVDTLWTAGFLILPSEWGVYAILSLAAIMIFVYLNLLYSLKVHSDFNKQSRIFCIIMVSVFSFVASESYITFFALLGKGVPWINYIFMFLYLASIIILFLINKKAKVVSAIP